MLTIVSMSRRPEMYKNFVIETEKVLRDLISAYYVFVNDPQLLPFYKSLEISNNKIKVFNAPEDFVFKYGHDTVYNYLEKQVQTLYILKLFDTDTIEVDLQLLKEELKQGFDIYGIETYMERGDVWENKFQLYKKGVLEWAGLVHENQHFKKPHTTAILKSLKVYHHNAVDPESEKLDKTSDGFIVLKKTKEGTDSDQRNLLYEYLGYRIACENGRHDHPFWFVRNYEVNKELIDVYVKRVKKKFGIT